MELAISILMFGGLGAFALLLLVGFAYFCWHNPFLGMLIALLMGTSSN